MIEDSVVSCRHVASRSTVNGPPTLPFNAPRTQSPRPCRENWLFAMAAGQIGAGTDDERVELRGTIKQPGRRHVRQVEGGAMSLNRGLSGRAFLLHTDDAHSLEPLSIDPSLTCRHMTISVQYPDPGHSICSPNSARRLVQCQLQK